MNNLLSVGKIKRLEVHRLWLQEEVRAGKVVIDKVGTNMNLADLGTKSLDGERVKFLMRGIDYI